MFTPELKSGAVKAVLGDWSLPPAEIWAVLPTGRQAKAEARLWNTSSLAMLRRQSGYGLSALQKALSGKFNPSRVCHERNQNASTVWVAALLKELDVLRRRQRRASTVSRVKHTEHGMVAIRASRL